MQQIVEIGDGWLRRDDEPTNQNPMGTARYWLPRPNGSPGITVLVTQHGLHFASDGVQAFSTEAQVDALERIIVLAHRQYQERLEHQLAPHATQEDVDLFVWLKANG